MKVAVPINRLLFYSVLSASTTALEALKKSLLHQAFDGQL